MDLNDLYGAGSDIMDAVNDAVSRNDFSGLSSSISKTVKEVSDTIQRDVREYNEKNRREDIRSRQYRNTAGEYSGAGRHKLRPQPLQKVSVTRRGIRPAHEQPGPAQEDVFLLEDAVCAETGK